MSEDEIEKTDDKELKDDAQQDIEILVSEDGNELDISPVYENLNTLKPSSSEDKPKNIIIPKEKK